MATVLVLVGTAAIATTGAVDVPDGPGRALAITSTSALTFATSASTSALLRPTFVLDPVGAAAGALGCALAAVVAVVATAAEPFGEPLYKPVV